MTVLRCTARLLKRLRQSAKQPEPAPAANPLGEWYADIDFIDREPFVLALNVATGAGLVLPGRAAWLRQLHEHAAHQLKVLFRHYGIDDALPGPAAEIAAWSAFPMVARTADRSVLGSLKHFKVAAWHHFAYENRSLPEAAARQWQGLYRHPSFAKPGRKYGYRDWERPLNLVVQRLVPGAVVLRVPLSFVPAPTAAPSSKPH